MKFKLIKLKGVKVFLKKVVLFLGQYAFLTFLILFLLSLVFSGLIFQKYSIAAKKAEPKLDQKQSQFNQSGYKNILKIWQEKEKKLIEADSKQYPNPFK